MLGYRAVAPPPEQSLDLCEKKVHVTARLPQAWRRLMLTTSVRFELITNVDDRHWRSVQLREEYGQKHSGMSRTPVARVFEIVAYKRRVESTSGNISASTLAELYSTKGACEMIGGGAATSQTLGVWRRAADNCPFDAERCSKSADPRRVGETEPQQ